MQLGTENRNKTIAAVGLMVLALAMVVMRFFPGSPASAKPPTPVVAPPPGHAADGGGTAQVGERSRPSAPPRVRLIPPCAMTG